MVFNKEACEQCRNRCFRIHEKKKCPTYSFFKILIGSTFSQFLYVPPEFVGMLTNLVGQAVRLEDASGRRWRVKVTNVNGSIAFEEGWRRFAQDHSLRFGELLVFTLTAESHFSVAVFGINACEQLNFSSKASENSINGKRAQREDIMIRYNENLPSDTCQEASHLTSILESKFSKMNDEDRGGTKKSRTAENWDSSANHPFSRTHINATSPDHRDACENLEFLINDKVGMTRLEQQSSEGFPLLQNVQASYNESHLVTLNEAGPAEKDGAVGTTIPIPSKFEIDNDCDVNVVDTLSKLTINIVPSSMGTTEICTGAKEQSTVSDTEEEKRQQPDFFNAHIQYNGKTKEPCKVAHVESSKNAIIMEHAFLSCALSEVENANDLQVTATGIIPANVGQSFLPTLSSEFASEVEGELLEADNPSTRNECGVFSSTESQFLPVIATMTKSHFKEGNFNKTATVTLSPSESNFSSCQSMDKSRSEEGNLNEATTEKLFPAESKFSRQSMDKSPFEEGNLNKTDTEKLSPAASNPLKGALDTSRGCNNCQNFLIIKRDSECLPIIPTLPAETVEEQCFSIVSEQAATANEGFPHCKSAMNSHEGIESPSVETGRVASVQNRMIKTGWKLGCPRVLDISCLW